MPTMQKIQAPNPKPLEEIITAPKSADAQGRNFVKIETPLANGSKWPSLGTVFKAAAAGLAIAAVAGYGALVIRVGGIPEANVAVKALFSKTFNQHDFWTISESRHLMSFFRQWNEWAPNGLKIDVNKECFDCGEGLDRTLLYAASHSPTTSPNVLADLLKAPMQFDPLHRKWDINWAMKQWNTDDVIGFIDSSLAFRRYNLLEDALKFGWIRANMLTPDQHFQILENTAARIGDERGIQFVKDFIASHVG